MKKTVMCELGIRVTEATARKVDKLVKQHGNNAQYKYRQKFFDAETRLENGERCDISTITTNTIDKDCEIVNHKGIHLDDYRANPVVLFGHNTEKPVGKCKWIKPTLTGLSAKTYYPERPQMFEGDWLSDYVFAMVQADVLRGKSIGIIPEILRDPTREEIEKDHNLQCVIDESLMIEYSVVSIPSNGKALVEAVSKGLVDPNIFGMQIIKQVKKQAKRKPIDYGPLVAELKRMKFDPTRIADLAMEQILKSNRI